MDLGTSCRPWPLECVCGLVVVDPTVLLLSFPFVCVCVGGFLVSFVLPLGVGFVISLGLFKPVGSAGMRGVTGRLGVTPRRLYRCPCCGGSSLLYCSFFCCSWPLGFRKASKQVMLELACAVSVLFYGVSCSGAANSSFRSVTTGSWAKSPRDELVTS